MPATPVVHRKRRRLIGDSIGKSLPAEPGRFFNLGGCVPPVESGSALTEKLALPGISGDLFP
jgi:hypothetical protein